MTSGPIYDDGVRYCRDCTHARPEPGVMALLLGDRWRNPKCAAPQLPGSFVMPTDEPYWFCSVVRASLLSCGPAGRWWEPR